MLDSDPAAMTTFQYDIRGTMGADQSPIGHAAIPFKFERRRGRLDWRVLHGIDINTIVHDTDIDTLEKVVGMIAYGDIEAEDTRCLTEINFVKVFRLSQLLVEYLLYVQDCLQRSNSTLADGRAAAEKAAQAYRSRCKELDAAARSIKHELKRSRKAAASAEALAAASRELLTQQMAAAEAERERRSKEDAARATADVERAAAEAARAAAAAARPASPAVVPMQDLLAQQQLADLSERLAAAADECSRLRSDREELAATIRGLERLAEARPAAAEAAQPAAAGQAELAAAQSELQMAQSEQAAATARAQQAQQQVAELRQQVAALRAALDTAQAECKEMAGAAAEVRQAREQLKQQLGDALAEVERLQLQGAEVGQRLQAAAGQEPSLAQLFEGVDLNDSVAAAQQQQRRLADLRSESEELKAQLRQRDAQVADMGAHLEQAGARAAELTAWADRLAAGGDGGGEVWQQERAQLLSQVQALEAAATEASDVIRRLKRENLGLAQQLEQVGGPEVVGGDRELRRSWQIEELERLEAQVKSQEELLGRYRQQYGQMAGGIRAGSPAAKPSPPVKVRVNDIESFISRQQQQQQGRDVTAAPAGAEAAQQEQEEEADQEQEQLQLRAGGSSPVPKEAPAAAAPQESLRLSKARHALLNAVDRLSPSEVATAHRALHDFSERPGELSEAQAALLDRLLVWELASSPGVLSNQPHTEQELRTAMAQLAPDLAAELADELQTYGLDPTEERVSDGEYVLLMKELDRRMELALAGQPPAAAGVAAELRPALRFHLQAAAMDNYKQGTPVAACEATDTTKVLPLPVEQAARQPPPQLALPAAVVAARSLSPTTQQEPSFRHNLASNGESVAQQRMRASRQQQQAAAAAVAQPPRAVQLQEAGDGEVAVMMLRPGAGAAKGGVPAGKPAAGQPAKGRGHVSFGPHDDDFGSSSDDNEAAGQGAPLQLTGRSMGGARTPSQGSEAGAAFTVQRGRHRTTAEEAPAVRQAGGAVGGGSGGGGGVRRRTWEAADEVDEVESF